MIAGLAAICLQLHERPPVRPGDCPAERSSDGGCFKPSSFGVICDTAIDKWYSVFRRTGNHSGLQVYLL